MTDAERAALLAKLDLTARLEVDGVTYRLDAEDLLKCAFTGDFTSSWAVSSVVSMARSKLGGKLPRREVLLLCAWTLRSTVESIEGTLDWNANYMAWHDGGSPEENHVWPPALEGNAPHGDSALPGGAD